MLVTSHQSRHRLAPQVFVSIDRGAAVEVRVPSRVQFCQRSLALTTISQQYSGGTERGGKNADGPSTCTELEDATPLQFWLHGYEQLTHCGCTRPHSAACTEITGPAGRHHVEIRAAR